MRAPQLQTAQVYTLAAALQSQNEEGIPQKRIQQEASNPRFRKIS